LLNWAVPPEGEGLAAKLSEGELEARGLSVALGVAVEL
jgi:hypothetical protein